MKQVSSMLRKGFDLLVIGVSYLVGEIEDWILRTGGVTTVACSAMLAWGLMFGGNLSAATVPAGFNETVISGPWINAVRSAFESNGRMSYAV